MRVDHAKTSGLSAKAASTGPLLSKLDCELGPLRLKIGNIVGWTEPLPKVGPVLPALFSLRLPLRLRVSAVVRNNYFRPID